MSQSVKVPTVGESISEVTIASWKKKEGEVVKLDEIIAELESDKATFELAAPQAGILRIKKQAGNTAAIGEIICEIEENKGKVEPVAPKANSTPSSGVKEMHVPAVGESIKEVTVSKWLKKEGDFVSLDEILAEVESDKATFELPAEANGILHIVAQEKTTLPVGGLICKIEISQAPGKNQAYAQGHPSPAAAKILNEKGVSADQVQGNGLGGRITKEDAQKVSAPEQKAPTLAPASTPPVIKALGIREERREKLSSLRKTISKRLVAVKNETAMLTTFNEVDMKPIMDLRAKYKDKFKEKHGVGLGFMSFFTKAVCAALQEFPAVNAGIDKDEIIYHNYCDISIAVSTPKGLVVPVIRNAEHLSMAQIEQEVIRLATRGRDGKLSIEEMTGGTFSITNGGVFGSMLSTPIINAPQAAILGMHNIVERPVAKNGEVVIRPIMYLALSYDHRIIDGRESVSFLVRLKEYLEEPGRLMLGV